MSPAAGTIAEMGDQSGHRTVLVVDDEPTISEVVSRYLERAGYEARTAADGLEAIRMVEERSPDLVVLDVMLPQVDGIRVLRHLRESQGSGVPVILLTAKGEQDDKLAGLRAGADDYVVKPFSPRELVARVDAVLRRTHPPDEEAAPLRFDQLEIDARGRRVTSAGEDVQLSQREFELLHYLATHPGQAFSRDELMERVWGAATLGDTSTVTVHVRRLRAKIEPEPERPRFVQTVWGVGYRFQP
jgi:two-component system, OmpR family, response regulator ResD